MSNDSVTELRNLIKKTAAKDRSALARLLTLLERLGPSAVGHSTENTTVDLGGLMNPSHLAFRIGITGPPGAGKSTLISKLLGEFRRRGRSLAVIAIDPSSPFSQGAVLGDRIRYADHVLDQNVFIRSLGSRGSLGGLSASAWLMVRAFDLAQFDIVLLETVGVGQTELEIMNVADSVAVVLTPESGDGIQGMKAGLMEISDLFVVNKGDRPGADSFAREIRAALSLGDGGKATHSASVLKVSALTGEGVLEFADALEEKMEQKEKWKQARDSEKRLMAEARAMLMLEAERRALKEASQIKTKQMLADLFRKIPKL